MRIDLNGLAGQQVDSLLHDYPGDLYWIEVEWSSPNFRYVGPAEPVRGKPLQWEVDDSEFTKKEACGVLNQFFKDWVLELEETWGASDETIAIVIVSVSLRSRNASSEGDWPTRGHSPEEDEDGSQASS